MLRISFSFLLLLLILSCKRHNYTVIINSKDSLNIQHHNFPEGFTAENDTLAYTEAAKRFWLYKNLIREINLKNLSDRPEPFAFKLLNANHDTITFPTQDAQRFIWQPSVIYYIDKFRKLDMIVRHPPRHLHKRVGDSLQ